MAETSPPTVLPYFNRKPVGRWGRRRVRVVRRGPVLTIAVFPGGVITPRFIVPVSLLVLCLAGGVHGLLNGTPSLLHALYLIGAATSGLSAFHAYVEGNRQVELDVEPEDLYLISFGPFGVRERRWPRQELSELRVHSGADHEPARLVLVRAIGGAEEILRGSRSQIKEVEGHLRDALRLSL